MRELSLNVLDIAENSVAANATLIEINIRAKSNILVIEVKDNGKGMTSEFLNRVTDPFTTTRTTRDVGMGLPLFKQAAELSGGRFQIDSQVGKGTNVYAEFQIDHLDRMPLGDIGETVSALIMTAPHIDYIFHYSVEDASFTLDTREVKETLDGIPIESIEVTAYLREFLKGNITETNGGIAL
ncbi:MAG: ATP-binding protein [Clostridia bacterium]